MKSITCDLANVNVQIGTVAPSNPEYSSWIKDEIPQKRLKTAVYARSWKWQNAIKLALNGDVIAIPDGCEGSCRADPEISVEVWKFDPSLPLRL